MVRRQILLVNGLRYQTRPILHERPKDYLRNRTDSQWIARVELFVCQVTSQAAQRINMLFLVTDIAQAVDACNSQRLRNLFAAHRESQSEHQAANNHAGIDHARVNLFHARAQAEVPPLSMPHPQANRNAYRTE